MRRQKSHGHGLARSLNDYLVAPVVDAFQKFAKPLAGFDGRYLALHRMSLLCINQHDYINHVNNPLLASYEGRLRESLG